MIKFLLSLWALALYFATPFYGTFIVLQIGHTSIFVSISNNISPIGRAGIFANWFFANCSYCIVVFFTVQPASTTLTNLYLLHIHLLSFANLFGLRLIHSLTTY